MRSSFIPKKLQNVTFMLMLFSHKLRQKVRNRAGYSSLFLKACAKKSCRLKYRILKYLGYIIVKSTLLVFLLLTGCATGKLNLREGIHSFQVQDYRQAFVRLKPEAEKGQPDAQYAVGYMYYYGQGVVEDRRQAWYWITRAAHAGQVDAKAAVRILGGKHVDRRR